MAFTYGFYNSIAGDRKYNTAQISELFDGLITDGVFMSIGNTFSITATDTLKVLVDTGRAWFKHNWVNNDSAMLVDIDESEILLNRYDYIILENDVENRKFRIRNLKGIPASNPTLPILSRTDTLYQVPLCLMYRAAGSTKVYKKDITNKVGSELCPFATGILKSIDIDLMVSQWEDQWTSWMENNDSSFSQFMSGNSSEFNTWFTGIKDQLSTDAAGNLQLQINTNYENSWNALPDTKEDLNLYVDVGLYDLPLDTEILHSPDDGGTVAGSALKVTTGNNTIFQTLYLIEGGSRTRVKKNDVWTVWEGGAVSLISSWPVGSIFTTTKDDDPAILFGGGVWQKLEDRFLVGAGSVYNAGDLSGTASHVHSTGSVGLSVAQMPSHTHTQKAHNHYQNAHNHSQNSHTHAQYAHNHTQNAHNHSQNAHNHSQNAHAHTQRAHSHTMQYGRIRYVFSSSGNSTYVGTKSPMTGTYETQVLQPTIYSATATNNSAKATNNYATAVNKSTVAYNYPSTASNNSTTAINNSTIAVNEYTGSGASHNHGNTGTASNIPPCRAVYMWERLE